MQAVKLKVNVENHRVTVSLPAEVPDGDAELVLLYEDRPAVDVQVTQRKYLEALFERIRQREPNRSVEDIDRQIAEERDGWGE